VSVLGCLTKAVQHFCDTVKKFLPSWFKALFNYNSLTRLGNTLQSRLAKASWQTAPYNKKERSFVFVRIDKFLYFFFHFFFGATPS